MKTFTKILSAITLAAVFAAGCVNEDPAYNKGGQKPVVPGDAQGYLTFGGMSMRVIYDTETELRPDDTGNETRHPNSRPEATQPAVDDFIIDIVNAANESVLKKSYGELKAMFDTAEEKQLPLPVGTYTMHVRSEEQDAMPAVAWEHPVYGTSYDFSIRKDTATAIGEVVCKLQNIKVTLMCSADLAAKLTDDTSSTVSLGAAAIVFQKGETRAAYFLPQEESNTLDFHLTGKFADTQEPTEFSKTITDVKAGQWRKISLVISHADKGGIKLDIEVDNFIQDEEIIVDGTEGGWEPEIPDPESPVPTIVWADHDLARPFQLKASMFDAEGKCTEPFALDLASSTGIGSFAVSITSDNAEFMTALLNSLQLQEAAFDLCAVAQDTPLYAALKGFGFPLGDEICGAKNIQVDLAGLMPLLYNAPGFEGNHTFAFALTDKNGQTSNVSLLLLVDKDNESGEPASAPTIAWNGYDIDRQHTVTDGMTLDIAISAPDRISEFVIAITSSDENFANALALIDLGEPFDLCNITDTKMAENLQQLGFPMNDGVKDKTGLSFNLTQFIPMLALFPGEHNFALTVKDSQGNATTKTLQLKVEAAS